MSPARMLMDRLPDAIYGRALQLKAAAAVNVYRKR